MLRLFFTIALVLAVTQTVATASIGFDWIWPPPFGLVESQKSIAPCGGFNGTSSNVTHLLNQLRWNQSATEITYMTRVAQTLNVTSNSTQWTELYPAVQASMDQASANNNATASDQFCIPVSEPPGVESPTIIFQLIANTPDGIVFACSRVSFQTTANESYTQTCNPGIRGNNTVNNITDPTLLSAAALAPGATAISPSSSSSSSSSQLPSASSSQATSASVSTGRKHLSGGAIAGIVVGSIVAACCLLVLLFLLFWHSRQKSRTEPKTLSSESEASGSEVVAHRTVPAPSGQRTAELPAVVPRELDAQGTSRSELPASDDKLFRPELPANPTPNEKAGYHIQSNEAPRSVSSEAAPVSPVTSSPHHEGVSPVSPIMDRTHPLRTPPRSSHRE